MVAAVCTRCNLIGTFIRKVLSIHDIFITFHHALGHCVLAVVSGSVYPPVSDHVRLCTRCAGQEVTVLAARHITLFRAANSLTSLAETAAIAALRLGFSLSGSPASHKVCPIVAVNGLHVRHVLDMQMLGLPLVSRP